MNLIETSLFAYILAWFGFMGGIWALFDRAETVASTDTKAAVSRWLRNLDPTKAMPNWPTTFVAMFDHVFGERHLSWRCFLRSCIASFISVLIVMLIWMTLRSGFYEMLWMAQDEDDWGILIGFFVVVVVYAVMLNVIPDYLSLLDRCQRSSCPQAQRQSVRLHAR